MKYWCLMMATVLGVTSFAQNPNFGGFPASTRWKQLDSDTARVIFTPGAGEQAERIATLIHRLAADTSLAFGDRQRKINILLQSRTTQANGYVALAPYRSEFYLIPSSNVFELGNLSWHENLAIHEYRHVQQYNNFRRGWSKALYYLFGEGGQALANSMSVPDWFFEGDAVYAETAHTPQGRGRLPFFLSGYNSLWLEGRNYNWQKLRNGSLKDYVPNHYQLGYLLVNYGYLKYGSRFWDQVATEASAFKGLFYPFQAAVKRHAGIPFKQFRKEALDYYRKQLDTTAGNTVRSTRMVTNLYFPQMIGTDSLLYLKSAFNRLPAFYLYTGGREQRIGLQQISSEEWFSYRNGAIAYTAFSTHPRWNLVDYSDIVIHDLRSGRERRLTRRSRYYSPDFSPSGRKIVAVQVTDSLETRLQVLSAEDGRVLEQYTTASNTQAFFNPRFVDENRIVVGVRYPDTKMEMQVLSPGAKPETLIPPSFNTIAVPFVSGERVYFTSNATGNDEVYTVGLADKTIRRLTTGQTGNYYPSVRGDSLVWSHFTTRGLQIQTAGMDPAKGTVVSNWQDRTIRYPVAYPQNVLGIMNRRFSEKRYDKSTGLFNFHSWQPNYVDPEFTFSLFSDNILNTFSNVLYYRYNQNEKSHAVGLSTLYGGLFPVLSAGVEYNFNRSVALTRNIAQLDELEASLGYYIPLNLTKGKGYRFMNFGSSFVVGKPLPKGPFKDSLITDAQTYLSHFLSFSHYLPMARQHIFPKLGLTSSFTFRHDLQDRRRQFGINGNLFLPSLGNHAIVVNGAYQDTRVSAGTVPFTNRFPLSRGYTDLYFTRMWKVGANYHFPLFYPDLGIAQVVYFQRLRANGFFDYSRIISLTGSQAPVRSVGGELYFDTRWWNQLPVTFGLRLSYLLDETRFDRKGTTFFEFILPVNLIPR